MREIKFRFWSEATHKMYQPVAGSDLLIKGDGDIYCWTDIYENGGLVKVKNQIPLQYTGLHDKNGKEIYDGDILRYQQKLYDGRPNGSRGLKEVRWSVSERKVGWNIADNQTMEIVGNIYENPDLAEKAI